MAILVMLNNLSCYYLKQMGITPWICRQSNVRAEQAITIKLLVLSEDHLKENEHRLLEQIIFFLGLEKKEWLHGSVDSIENPQAILSFGINAAVSQVSEPLLLKFEPLSYFLINPLSKKAMYQKLIPMRNTFTPS